MSENESFYTFLGKIDAFDGQYIGGMNGVKKLIERLGIRKDPDFKVLEVGAATGFTSCYVAKAYGCNVTSTDISEGLVEKGRRRAKRLRLSNMEFMKADAMDLNFPYSTFDAVYGISITGVLPHKLRALEEYIRVVKPGGVVGGLELFIRNDASSDVEAAINLTMGKVVGTGINVMRLDEWRRLIEKTGMRDVMIDEFYEDVFEDPSFGLNSISTYFKLVYYLITNSWFRFLFFEVMELRKSVTETRGDIFSNIGYLIYSGKK